MKKINAQTNIRQRLLLTLFLGFFALSVPHHANAKGSPVNTWYKVKAKGYSKTVKAKKIVVSIPGVKSKEKRIKILLGSRPTFVKATKIFITAHGSGSRPTPKAQGSSSTSTVSSGDVTITTTTTIDDKGNSETKTTRTQGSSSGGGSTTTTTTTSTDSNGNTSTSTSTK